MFNPDYPVIAVTNRHLCKGDFLQQIDKICALPYVSAILLREKDLNETEYLDLARSVIERVGSANQERARQQIAPIQLILHQFLAVARSLSHPAIHLPFATFLEQHAALDDFTIVGTSIHSLSDAQTAQQYGATYVTAGHIYPTNCKPDLPARGLDFLQEVTSNTELPVYGIGGIHPHNADTIVPAGAAGVCMMSEFMQI